MSNNGWIEWIEKLFMKTNVPTVTGGGNEMRDKKKKSVFCGTLNLFILLKLLILVLFLFVFLLLVSGQNLLKLHDLVFGMWNI